VTTQLARAITRIIGNYSGPLAVRCRRRLRVSVTDNRLPAAETGRSPQLCDDVDGGYVTLP
jgi:hypothetical protein